MLKVAKSPGVGDLSLASRVLHGLDRWAARPAVAATVVAVDLMWVVYSVAVGFPGRLETVFQTLVAALTLMLVFVIQHTQAKVSAATQRKLDEILRALPDADEALIGLERGPDEKVQATARAHLLARAVALSSRAQ